MRPVLKRGSIQLLLINKKLKAPLENHPNEAFNLLVRFNSKLI